MGAVTPERRIEGAGTPEPVWRAWLDRQHLPRMQLDALLPPEARAVVVAPHPDDEVLGCGALLAAHLARGGATLLLALTDGEASHGPGTGEAHRALAATRRAEQEEGLARLGALPGAAARDRLHLDVFRWAIPDGSLGAHADALAARLARLLEPDDVVITTWRLDGHPDHEAAGHACAEAAARSGCRLIEAPVWAWHWARPADPRVPWHRMRGFAPAREALARKLDAIGAHASQLAARGADLGPVLNAGILDRAQREVEYFII
jgi:LmbE family N-acetylglucosaminyl deacetylase